jgi:2,4-dienoyl-CoA reductase-like NADH-dependent reductase (Old Yellow Enzyme family)
MSAPQRSTDLHPMIARGTRPTMTAENRVNFPQLLSPLRIGPIEVRNRAVVTGHGAFLDFYKPTEPADRYIDYLARRAEGGAGLIILQPAHVHPSSHALGHYVYEPGDLARKLALMANALHNHGAKTVIQLFHFGAQFTSDARRSLEPLWAFSPIASPEGEIAHEMNDEEIEAVIEGFVTTARIAAAAGLDGVELHATHGYLLQQSFSPWANQRTDRWGQPLAFVSEVMRRVRAVIGRDKVMGLRISADDWVRPDRGGLGADGCQRVAAACVATGLLDYLNHSEGARASHYARSVGTWRRPHGEHLPLARGLRAAIGAAIPVIGVGRVTTPQEAEQALADGACDLVAMTRAHVADPDVIAKTMSGRTTRIRPCVGANQGCVDRMVGGLPITCFHNPSVGREAATRELTPGRGSVLVVGGGPAGLKAAEMAARRGYHVTLAEARARLGGRLLAVEKLGPKRELLLAIDWLERTLDELGVRVLLHHGVTSADLLAFDRVIIATGAHSDPARRLNAGDGSIPIVSTEQAVHAAWVDPMPAAQRVLVIDTLGNLEVASAAEYLAVNGCEVIIATASPQYGHACGFTHLKELLERLPRLGIRFETSSVLVAIDGGRAMLRHLYTGEQCALEVEAIVGGVAPFANDSLAHAARAARVPVLTAGDAVAPRSALHAFREGDDAGRAV